jgi:hypothetical protein
MTYYFLVFGLEAVAPEALVAGVAALVSLALDL